MAIKRINDGTHRNVDVDPGYCVSGSCALIGKLSGATPMSGIWLVLTLLLAACSHSHRFDAMKQQQLQQQQNACLARGGNPQQCRP
jgi:hypothetical protein